MDWTDVPCRSFAPGAAYLAIERVGGMAMSEQNIVDFIFCQNESSGSDAIVDPHSFTVGAIAGWGDAAFYAPRLGPSMSPSKLRWAT